jgi:hypothetical protein
MNIPNDPRFLAMGMLKEVDGKVYVYNQTRQWEELCPAKEDVPDAVVAEIPNTEVVIQGKMENVLLCYLRSYCKLDRTVTEELTQKIFDLFNESGWIKQDTKKIPGTVKIRLKEDGNDLIHIDVDSISPVIEELESGKDRILIKNDDNEILSFLSSSVIVVKIEENITHG